jgi:4-hydroxy-2-oxoheptanedioate aldolase
MSKSGRRPGHGRLNSVIDALERRSPAFLAFARADSESAELFAGTSYDGVVFEMEHSPYDIRGLQHALQQLLDRRRIAQRGTLAASPTPLVRIPPNGSEMNSWIAKQVLDLGVYGLVWPHVSTVEEARNAVAACRYPRPPQTSGNGPQGIRGDMPLRAARYWGLTVDEYYARADVWPLASAGEILVCIQCEELKAIANLPKILREVPGVAAVLIGEGDLSQEMGIPRQFAHPSLLSAIAEVVAICREANVPVGHPHVDEENVEAVLRQGFRWLMSRPTVSHPALERGRTLAKRS